MTFKKKETGVLTLTTVHRGSLESNKAMYVKGKVMAEFVDLTQRPTSTA